MTTSLVPPDPETIRRTAAEIVNGPDFIVNQETGFGDAYVDILLQLLEWVIIPFRWLFEAMDGLPDVLRWLVVIGLFLVLVILIGHILYSIFSTLRPATRDSKFTSSLASNRKLSAEEYEQLSQEAIAQLDYISAVRFLFKASLTHLQSLEGRILSPGLTNRQYLRRYQKTRYVAPLQSFVDIIDASWYGSSVCREEEYLKCRNAYTAIRYQTKEGTHANIA